MSTVPGRASGRGLGWGPGRSSHRSRRGARDLLRRLPAFVVVGSSWTCVYVLLFAGLREALSAQTANVVALVATTVGATAGHRRWTFRADPGPWRVQALRQALGLALLGLGTAATAGALWTLEQRAPRASVALEALVLLGATVVVGAVRFVVLGLAMPPADRVRRAGEDPPQRPKVR